MSDLLRDGAAYLAAKLQGYAGTQITIARGATTATVTATIGRSVFEAADANGVVEAWESRDYLLPTADLPFGEPQRFDRITETMNGAQCVYEVTSPRGVPLFHYADAFQEIVRIHTKRIS